MPCWSYWLLYRCLLTLIRWRIGQVQGDNPIALGMTFIRSLHFSLQLIEELATEDSSKWTSVLSIPVFRKGSFLPQQQKQQLLNNVRDGAKTALDRYQKFALKTRNLLEYVLLFVPSEAKKMKASTLQSPAKFRDLFRQAQRTTFMIGNELTMNQRADYMNPLNCIGSFWRTKQFKGSMVLPALTILAATGC